MHELLMTALPVAEISIIKRDFDLLRKLVPNLTNDVQTQIVPYSALFCYEVITYLKKFDPSIEVEQTSKYSIKDIRQKAKFFDLSVNKLIQSVNNVDTMQNGYFVNLMKYPQLGYWNLHTNLGIYYDNDKHIVGNTHYAYYIFQDEKSISKPQSELNDLELEGKELQAFGYDMGVIIGNISSAFSETSDFMESDVVPKGANFLYQDFNTNRCTTNGNEKYKSVLLFLLHILSSIGFVLYCLKRKITRDTGLLLRLEYITYHYALKQIDGIRKYCKTNNSEISDCNLLKLLESIDCSNSNNLRNTNFRNCMMHFELKNKDGNPLISENNLNLAVPFCGLVETQFNLSYSEYQALIEKELVYLYDAINDYLGFGLLLKD
ncbi:MAG: hypothetical protein NC223_02170 [Butyrivibrio sp.]|nr:hypothetical protein [Butyrivibrio sp.]